MSTSTGPARTALDQPDRDLEGAALVDPPSRSDRLRRRLRAATSTRVLLGIAVGCALAGLVVRFLAPRDLWLDEALTVAIANRPVPDVIQALRVDGSPPLYYLLLHGWISAFGDSAFAVRSLSGVLSLAALPLGFRLGRRIGGRPLAVTVALLLATSPYALRYGSETRMYSLVLVLVLLGGLVLLSALERPRPAAWAGLTAITAALAFTHYWTFFLLITVGTGLLVRWRRGGTAEQRRAAGTALAAVAGAGLLFAPWLPIFIDQLRHTGTPWAAPVQPRVLADTLFEWGGPGTAGLVLALSTILLASVGLFAADRGAAAGGEQALVVLSVRANPVGRWLAVLFAGPLLLAFGVSLAGASGFAVRYTGIAYPGFLLLVALGVVALPGQRRRAAVLAIACVAGLVAGTDTTLARRTQGGQVARVLAEQVQPGDVVAYCPDQLGPAVSRVLGRPAGVVQRAYADRLGPERVDWVDYAQRMADATPEIFGRELVETDAPTGRIFLVQADGYRTLGSSCGRIGNTVSFLRGEPKVLVVRRPRAFEGMTLLTWEPRGSRSVPRG